jgi:hypothetical protein
MEEVCRGRVVAWDDGVMTVEFDDAADALDTANSFPGNDRLVVGGDGTVRLSDEPLDLEEVSERENEKIARIAREAGFVPARDHELSANP